MSGAGVESDRRQWEGCVLMKAKPPDLDACRTRTHHFGCRQRPISDETRCPRASIGRPWPFWTRASGECRLKLLPNLYGLRSFSPSELHKTREDVSSHQPNR